MTISNTMTNLFLRFFAFNFNHRKSLNRYLKTDDGFLDFTFGVRTESGSVNQALIFSNGKVKVSATIPPGPDAMLVFRNEQAMKEAAVEPPNRLMLALMENRLLTQGNLAYLQLFNFYLSLLL